MTAFSVTAAHASRNKCTPLSPNCEVSTFFSCGGRFLMTQHQFFVNWELIGYYKCIIVFRSNKLYFKVATEQKTAQFVDLPHFSSQTNETIFCIVLFFPKVLNVDVSSQQKFRLKSCRLREFYANSSFLCDDRVLRVTNPFMFR